MKKAFIVFGFICAAVSILGGCSHYYKVRDPASGTVYYTNDVDHVGSGAVRFKDVVSQQQVTLSASEVMPITKDEYRANVHGR